MILTDRQQRAADKLLDEEGPRRTHLVVSLSGAHAYGFPSPDSDLDLKAVHIEETENLLALEWVPPPAERLEGDIVKSCGSTVDQAATFCE